LILLLVFFELLGGLMAELTINLDREHDALLLHQEVNLNRASRIPAGATYASLVVSLWGGAYASSFSVSLASGTTYYQSSINNQIVGNFSASGKIESSSYIRTYDSFVFGANSVTTTPIATEVALLGKADLEIYKKTSSTEKRLLTTDDIYTHPNHTGDVTSVGGGATTIANDAVTNAKMANMAASTFKGRITASTGDPEDMTAAQAASILPYTSLLSRPSAETNSNDMFQIASPGGVSAFAGTIASLPGGAVLTYNVSSGQEGAMVPALTTHLAKMRLYNTTRGNYALINNCVVATNTITLTANVPAGWANGDTITIASNTVSGGGFSWVDMQITSGPTGKTQLFLYTIFQGATAGDSVRMHPHETLATSKYSTPNYCQVAGVFNAVFGIQKIVSNVFSLAWTGNPTAVYIRESGYLE